MNKTRAASVIVAVSATVMWMGSAAFAAGGFGVKGFGTPGQTIRIGANVETIPGSGSSTTPSQCFTDRDRDDRTGHPSDHDGDESHSCHHSNASPNMNDGDSDSDDVTSNRCFTD